MDDQPELGRLLYRQVSRLGALEGLSDVNAGLVINNGHAGSVANQPADRGGFSHPIHRRNGMACCRCHDSLAPRVEKRIGAENELAGLQLNEAAKAAAISRAEFLHQCQNDYPAYPRVALIFKEASETIGDPLGDIAKTDCGRLVLFSVGRVFLIRPVSEVPTAKPDSIVLFADQLQALRLLDEYRSCR